MADEQNKPTEAVEEFVKEAPVEAADQIRHVAEELESSPAVQAFEEGKEALVEAIDKIAPPPGQDKIAGQWVGEHYVGDSTVILGWVINQPVYTVVYVGLAVVTLIEVALSQLPRGFLTIPVMLGLALVKAGLVVWFYMHLNKDNRLFMLTLLAPVVMVILATGFLMLVPAGY